MVKITEFHEPGGPSPPPTNGWLRLWYVTSLGAHNYIAAAPKLNFDPDTDHHNRPDDCGMGEKREPALSVRVYI